MRKYFFLSFLLLINCKNNEIMNYNLNEVELSDGVVVRTTDLTDKQYKEILINDKEIKRIYNNITISEPDILIYEMSTGDILVSSEGYHSIYNKIEDLIKVMDDYDEKGHEILLNKNSFKQDFPSHVAQMEITFLNELGINKFSDEKLDLNLIDNRINSLQNKDAFIRQHFLELIAVVGNKIVKENDGIWEMLLASDNKTWNPYIIIQKKKIDITSYLYEDIVLENRGVNYCYKSVNDIIQRKN